MQVTNVALAVVVGLLLLGFIILNIVFKLIYKVSFVRMAALTLVALIKQVSPLVGEALGKAVETIIWF
jgi:hypothetical protein